MNCILQTDETTISYNWMNRSHSIVKHKTHLKTLELKNNAPDYAQRRENSKFWCRTNVSQLDNLISVVLTFRRRKKAKPKRPSSTALATIQITYLAPDDIRKIWSDVPKCLRLFTKIDCLEPQTVTQCLWQSNNDRRKNGWKLNYLWRCHYPCFPNDRTLLNKIN